MSRRAGDNGASRRSGVSPRPTGCRIVEQRRSDHNSPQAILTRQRGVRQQSRPPRRLRGPTRSWRALTARCTVRLSAAQLHGRGADRADGLASAARSRAGHAIRAAEQHERLAGEGPSITAVASSTFERRSPTAMRTAYTLIMRPGRSSRRDLRCGSRWPTTRSRSRRRVTRAGGSLRSGLTSRGFGSPIRPCAS